MELVREWAGKERLFSLSFGGVLDLEQACGDVGLGEIFVRVASGRFRVGEVYHIIRLALIGGGMSKIDAKRLMGTHFDARPYIENNMLAAEILEALMVGIEPSEKQVEDVPPAHKFSEVSQICRIFNISPVELRAMRFADFANMVKGYAAGTKTRPDHITEEEFLDILNKYEPEAVQDGAIG